MSPAERYPEPDPPLDLSDNATVIQYHNRLETARHLAQLHGLTSGLSISLGLIIPSSNPLPYARSLPHFPRQSTISFRLSQALQSGLDKNSQVWTAVGEFSDAQTTIVLKIIQPSMCRYPAVDDAWINDYVFAENLAREEAWVYSQLLHKQGLCVPYFFGLHTVRSIVRHLPRTSHSSVCRLQLRQMSPRGFWRSNTSPAKHCSRTSNRPRNLCRIRAT